MCGEAAPVHDETCSSQTSETEATERTAVLSRLVDAHAHPTDWKDYAAHGPHDCGMQALQLSKVCSMSSTLDNQDLITELCEAYPKRIIPFYGLHPWWSHQLSLKASNQPIDKEEHYRSLHVTNNDEAKALDDLLPHLRQPTHLSSFLAKLESNLVKSPFAMLGEVGLDKSFRLPEPSDSPGTKKTILATPIPHQVAVLEAQIDVALKLGRNISFHSVRAPQDTVEFLAKLKLKDGWGRINLCLHSFGGSPQTIRQISKEHRNVFFSFAEIVSGRSPKYHELLAACPSDRLLVESDWYSPHVLDEQVWKVFQAIKLARTWTTEECLRTLDENWKAFISEPPPPPPPKPKRSKKAKAPP